MNRFLWTLAWRSAWNRRFTLGLTVGSIALSAFMLLGIERVRTDLRDSFSSAVSGTDLIMGARTGSVQLLLYAVFHVGSATNNIRWDTVQSIQKQPGIAWVVPLSLGDSHRGFSVLGTTTAYFSHFQYGYQLPLRFAQGKPFVDLYDAVIGAEVARSLGYQLGDHITLTHGSGELNLSEHADKPFVITGVLEPTGTPVDRVVHISLEAMEALHLDWILGTPMPGLAIDATTARTLDLTPKAVTAALVGLENRSAVFAVQRRINEFQDEALMGILPGVALDELWEVIGIGERAMLLMSGMVAFVSIVGLVSVVLAGLSERRREMAILRAVGASSYDVVWLLMVEGTLVTLVGIAFGATVLSASVMWLSPWLQSSFGLVLKMGLPTQMQAWLLVSLLSAGCLSGLIPGWLAYRMSLADGLSPRS